VNGILIAPVGQLFSQAKQRMHALLISISGNCETIWRVFVGQTSTHTPHCVHLLLLILRNIFRFISTETTKHRIDHMLACGHVYFQRLMSYF